jgi:DNA-binding GntR family transcriptional regulator
MADRRRGGAGGGAEAGEGAGLAIRAAFSPVAARSTMQDGVYQQLRQALMTGLFDPGQALTVAALAEMCRTSQMPVREALRRLAAENAVEIAASGSARVPAVSPARLADLCRARREIEGFAAELAARHATEADVAEIEAFAARHAASAGDLMALLARNQDFHFALYRAARSEVLLGIVETLWLRFGPYMRLLTLHLEPGFDATRPEVGTGFHAAALEAVRERRPAAARAAIADDIANTEALLTGLMRAPAGRRAAS